jgi:hypothetical protein
VNVVYVSAGSLLCGKKTNRTDHFTDPGRGCDIHTDNSAGIPKLAMQVDLLM